MSTAEYKPRRQGITYPTPSNPQWRRILRKCKHVDTGYATPCWIWCGRIDTDGYGECKYNGAKRFIHRIAYASLRGTAPARRDVDHKCKQRACCNPEHLAARQPLDNASDNNPHASPLQFNKTNIFDLCDSRGTLLPVPF
jgi:hypothetical protein